MNSVIQFTPVKPEPDPRTKFCDWVWWFRSQTDSNLPTAQDAWEKRCQEWEQMEASTHPALQ